MSRRAAALAASVLVAVLLFRVSSAQTYQPGTVGYLLQHGCARATRLKDAAYDAYNTGHITKALRLYKEASDLFYYCAKQTSDPYVHDWALERYAEALAIAGTRDDPWVGIACFQLNELAYETRFSDVRKAALQAKRMDCGGAGAQASPSSNATPLSAFTGTWTGSISDALAGSGQIWVSIYASPGGSLHGDWPQILAIRT
jgi:hypothetical protein